jgi:hypothetical protein
MRPNVLGTEFRLPGILQRHASAHIAQFTSAVSPGQGLVVGAVVALIQDALLFWFQSVNVITSSLRVLGFSFPENNNIKRPKEQNTDERQHRKRTTCSIEKSCVRIFTLLHIQLLLKIEHYCKL